VLLRANFKPTTSEVRYFSLTLAVLAVIVGLVIGIAQEISLGVWIGGGGLVLAAACALLKPLGRLVFVLWAAVSYALGFVISPLIIAVIYYVVLTPIGLWARISGKDELRIRRQPITPTYLCDLDLPFDKESFHRQF
jgi:hypothetical protein